MSEQPGPAAPYSPSASSYTATQPAPVTMPPARPPDRVVTPTAIAQAAPSAAFGLGEVLMDIIHGTQVYATEQQTVNAINTVRKWVGQTVSKADLNALADGTERAASEDVTQRVAPNQAGYTIMQPALDYDKLAAAILRAQTEAKAAVQ
jgi:hypothetical protein